MISSIRYWLLGSLLVAAWLSPAPAHAQVTVGGQTCYQVWALYDYYSGGQYIGSQWEADGVNCYDNGGSFDGGSGDFGLGGGGGGGGGGSFTVPDRAGNPNNAECSSPVNDRQAHASWDVRQYQAQRLATFQGTLRTGDIVTVTYDDGATERWVVTGPLLTDPVAPTPVAGSLRCG